MRVVGVDLGRRRIGLALSDRSATLATPWRAVRGDGAVAEVVARLVVLLRELGDDADDADDQVSGIVVGLPSHLDGRPHELSGRVRAVAAELEQQTGLRVTLQDERLTSVEAEQRLALRERDWRKRKARLDAAAAAVLLQDYLDEDTKEAGDRRQETDEV